MGGVRTKEWSGVVRFVLFPDLIHTFHLYLYEAYERIIFVKYCNNRVFYIYCIGPAGCVCWCVSFFLFRFLYASK